jgi:hypothetical protein
LDGCCGLVSAQPLGHQSRRRYPRTNAHEHGLSGTILETPSYAIRQVLKCLW